MKKKKTFFNILIFSFLMLFFREIYYAVIYLYNIAVSRSNKFVLTKLTNINTEIDSLFGEIKLEEKNIKKWLKNTLVIGVKLTTFDNVKLFGEIFINNSSSKWVIILHGYGTQGEIMYYAGRRFYEQGFNVLIPDLRGHGISGGNYIGMGWHDRIDVIYWINEILERDENAKIVLYGISMGGSTVLMASGEKLPPNVKCIISDSAFTSAYNIFKYQIKSIHKIPAFPFLDMMGLICKFKNKYSIRKASALEQVKKSNVPILFIHGDKDFFVPLKMMQQLYNAAKCEKSKIIFKDAGHGTSAMVRKNIYWEKVFKFINNYVS